MNTDNHMTARYVIMFLLPTVCLIAVIILFIYMFGSSNDYPSNQYILVIRNISDTDVIDLNVTVGNERILCETIPIIQDNQCYKVSFVTDDMKNRPPNDVYVSLQNNDGSEIEYCTGYFSKGAGEFSALNIVSKEGNYEFIGLSPGDYVFDSLRRRSRWNPSERMWKIK